MRSRGGLRGFLICAALVALAVAVFWPLTRFGYVGYDDPDYVSRNPHVLTGFTWANFKWAFMTGHASNWHPLTWLSHMLDARLYGNKPGLHHLTNVILHCSNVVLLFLVLRRLVSIERTISATANTELSNDLMCAFVAALFAIHPMHVESVAWISERKDVLSGLFFMLTLLFYVDYVRYSDAATGVATRAQLRSGVWRKRCLYCLTLATFACGLMSKPMLVTLPCVLLLLDYWPLKRLSSASFIEKIPFGALSSASCVITFIAQQRGGAVETLDHVSFAGRLENAAMACFQYVEKFLWPSKLVILYLRPGQWPIGSIICAALLLVVLTAAAVALRDRAPYAFVGWFWFIGMLLPVIGLVQVGNQYMADRYTYLPYIGLFILVAWAGNAAARRFQIASPLTVAAASLTIALAVAAHRETRYWKDTATLFGRCIALTQNNFVAENILGAGLNPKSDFLEAKRHFLNSIRMRPGFADAQLNLGVLLAEHGDYSEAMTYLDQAIELRSGLAGTVAKLASALDDEGRAGGAIFFYREAVRINPNDVASCNNLAWLLATSADASLRNGADAVRFAQHACDLTGDTEPAIVGTLAAAYAESGRFDEAIATAEKAKSVALERNDSELAARNEKLAEVYRKHRPYHANAASR
jgi:tetratricopeptide (TPR) repeat protein